MKKILNTFLFGDRRNSQLEDTGKLALRLLFGLSLALNHGWPTFRGVLAGRVSDFPDPIGLGPELSMLLAGSAEFIFALFIVAGLLTRLAALPVVINFAVAFFIFHHGDAFGDKEMAYLYGTAMIVILLLGPGKYSLDSLLFKE